MNPLKAFKILKPSNLLKATKTVATYPLVLFGYDRSKKETVDTILRPFTDAQERLDRLAADLKFENSLVTEEIDELRVVRYQNATEIEKAIAVKDRLNEVLR